ncbi:ABC transporter ATP-binding protein [Clostridium sp. C8-1-8]|uniref:ABC transporter ATP-binding protein n=1 Tax=Clostridium sp. C8-1-8 TaxID=2698831 RepID=UPI00136C26DC|nr:ABC transporter ATP-binding protein [Clostridium sp. C8-1-8]
MRKLFNKSVWIFKQSKSIMLYLIIIIALGIISSFANVYRALITKNLVDTAVKGSFSAIYKYLIILGALILADILLNSSISIISTYSSTKLSNNLQKKLYSHITFSKWLDTTKYHSGDLLSRLTNDISTLVSLLVTTLPNVISLATLLFSSFFILLSYEPIVAVITIVLAPISLLFSRIYAKKLKNIHLRTQENESKYISYMQESVQNILITKSFCVEADTLDKFSKLQHNKLKLSVSKSGISAFYSGSISLGYWLTYFIVFALGAYRLSLGALTFGTLTALLQLTGNVQIPLSGLASSLSQFITAYASTERLMAIEALELESAPKKHDKLDTFLLPIIQYDNVSFGYKEALPILKNVSFTLFPGEIVALVGPSGEGKTTLIRLLLSLINPKEGSAKIICNNEAIDISPYTRNNISYVPQGNTLFSGTIADNLRYGFPEATDEDIEKALKAAFAWDFVDKLPEKISTVIGEHGSGVSEGQAQRLVIARALIRRKPILLLDEATSALDMDTEVNVLKSIKTLEYHPTCIIITHRPSALAICSRVLKLEDGNIHEIDRASIQESALESLQ